MPGTRLGLGVALCVLACASAHAQATRRPFRVIGHRGAAGHAPENTLPGIERAVVLGVTEVELDVQLSRDDVLVLFHDATLDVKTDLGGRVRDHDADVLRRADIGSWFDREHPRAERRFAGTGLVTLETALRRFGTRLHYHLEIKAAEPEIPTRLLRAVAELGLQGHVTVTSFRADQLRRVRALDAEVPICLLVDRHEDLEPQLELALAQRFQMLGVRAGELTRARVERVHASGLSVRAWGVREAADLERVLAVGADGATLDWPEQALGRLRSPTAVSP